MAVTWQNKILRTRHGVCDYINRASALVIEFIYAPELVLTFYCAIKHGYRCFIS